MMDHTEVTHFVGMLVVILALAKLAGAVAQRLGQPAVLGELIGGLLAGPSVLGWVEPGHEAIRMMAELGVLILLFAIGLETDLSRLLRVGATSMTVAVVGVVLPFVLGYVACRCIGLSDMRSIMAAATLTATSVGITARVLADLGHLGTQEGQIILGAALIDDVLGLLLLTIVEGLSQGQEVSATMVLAAAGRAFGFLLAAAAAGTLGARALARLSARVEQPSTLTVLAMVLALGMAWVAERCGSAMIIGAFAAGVILSRLPRAHEIEKGITSLGHIFVPIFFVSVGASVDIGALNPLVPSSHRALITGGILIVVGIIGKFLAGFAPFWFRGNKAVVGVGMIPRGEVGLIFARIGLSSQVFDPGLFGATAMMVMVTTLLAPPGLKYLLRDADASPDPLGHDQEVEDLVAGV
jgi:Kef-type K+ transport system membrane component KefB